jgi:hypothetical protein
MWVSGLYLSPDDSNCISIGITIKPFIYLKKQRMPVRLDEKFGKFGAEPVVLAEIMEMTALYRKDMRAGDALSCWVSVAEVLQLIADNNGNGIRLYYGRHGDKEGPDFKGKHNIILVSTRDTTNPGSPTSENSVDLLNELAKKGPVNSVTVSFEGMGDDVIPLCPPHCPKGASVLK